MKHLFFLFFCLALVACGADEPVPSPQQRTLTQLQSLRDTLLSAEYGWRLVYFPKTDSLLFTDVHRKLKYEDQHGNYGYGGYYYLIKFAPDGTLVLQDDQNDAPTTARYALRHAASAQLSLTTFTPLHALIGTAYGAQADWLYSHRDLDGRHIWRTEQYNEAAREYIALERLPNAEAWDTYAQRARNNRKHFEAMASPQLRISRGDRVYFDSDLRMRVHPRDWHETLSQRYQLFSWGKVRNPDPAGYPLTVVGLGSGYVGTERGLLFQAGLRLTQSIVFTDFERQGDSYHCRLVRVYDPRTLHTRLVPAHLAPRGVRTEPTGYEAVIR